MICAGSLVVLTALAYKLQPFGHLDASILSRLSADRESDLGTVARRFRLLADPLPQIVMTATICLVAVFLRRPRQAVGALILIGGANLTTQLLKELLFHRRYQPLLGLEQIGPTGFPSGHSTAAMALALAVVLIVPRSWRWIVIVLGGALVAAVGASVVVLHNHYPSDVLGGWLVAAGWFFAVIALLRIDQLRRLQASRDSFAARS